MNIIYNLPKFPVRSAISHKGDYGVIVGVGGSRGMSGSISLAGRAGLLVGAGLSRLAVPSVILETVAGFYPDYTTIPLSCDCEGKISFDAIDKILEVAESATSLFIGTGLGRSDWLDKLVPDILQRLDDYGRIRGIVVDADALNALCGQIPTFRNKKVIFTPHEGEFNRLLQHTELGVVPDEYDLASRINITKIFAERYNLIMVLKGSVTIVTDGEEVFINDKSGNPGMATGGSGDILTGMTSGLIARGFSVFDAAKLGVYLHGVSGDIAAKKYGVESVIATYILESIPKAIINYTLNDNNIASQRDANLIKFEF
ncbi:MAG: NAD(P)H-hydrate dehydratase [Planctomycetaceae bacterium]|jgi:NAD(P)H-hydrate epimerase|nr:NAD(P)H-hydrate dehydratase [Planctomycetaceae bacterium]